MFLHGVNLAILFTTEWEITFSAQISCSRTQDYRMRKNCKILAEVPEMSKMELVHAILVRRPMLKLAVWNHGR